MKRCPKCGKAYDDSWSSCLSCSVQLGDSGVAIEEKQPTEERQQIRRTAEENKKINERRFLISFLIAVALRAAVALTTDPEAISTAFSSGNVLFVTIFGLFFMGMWNGLMIYILWSGIIWISKREGGSFVSPQADKAKSIKKTKKTWSQVIKTPYDAYVRFLRKVDGR